MFDPLILLFLILQFIPFFLFAVSLEQGGKHKIIKKCTKNKFWRGSEEKGTLLHCWCKCKLEQPLWRTVWKFLKQLKKELWYDPAIPVLGLYLDRTIIWKDTCTPVLTATLFTIAKTWQQPKSPLTEEWIKKMWHKYTMGYYSAIRKEWSNAICSNTDGPRDCHTEWNKWNRERQISYDITYMQNL